ncbi:MAG: GHMP kinase [Armatimonadota bacterium]|nr:GHMP kinase [Armatimonadota bacterium]
MIISRTPLRMSFVGGGSDLEDYYAIADGAVLSTTINKYVWVSLNPKFDHRTRISYSRTEEVETVDDIEHPLVREAMKMLGVAGGIEITSIADIPSRGTGLGSSSGFTIGLLHVLYAHLGQYASAERLARGACEVEITRCREPIGKQDQYAAAYGGLNFIQFHSDGRVSVDPIVCRKDTLVKLQDNIICFYTGIVRSASEILRRQGAEVRSKRPKQKLLAKMVQLAHDLRVELQNNNTDSFGEIIHENWRLKRSLAGGISTTTIDEWYAAARQAGALGGKLLGAGTGGFMMFYAPKEHHEAISRKLSALRRVDLRFEPQGSKIIFVH